VPGRAQDAVGIGGCKPPIKMNLLFIVMDEHSNHEELPEPCYRGQTIVHDSIYGSFQLPDIAWKIIDTPAFQRLRHIKQTSNTSYVYPGAEHTRFQHCLGVAHLSLEFAQRIQAKHPDLLSDHEVLLICLAGLCHDLGHSAYSHLYDGRIVPIFDPDSKFKHEDASYTILKKIGILVDEDVVKIGKLIFGSPKKVPDSLKDILIWDDTDHMKQFMYEIVSNERTGTDVDKFDYLKRDSHYTGIVCPFDPQRLMQFFYIDRITKGSKVTYILEYHSKACEQIDAMWRSRDDLHRRVYQHRVVKCIDLMITDMIVSCADMPLDDIGTKLCDAHKNLDTYLKLTDHYLFVIAENYSARAKAISTRLHCRDLWPTIAMIDSQKKLTLSFEDKNIVFAEAQLRDSIKYYIYYKGDYKEEYDKELFYRQLIESANGASIYLRELK
jgi:HD superfamily phosphohydrolase